jgi:SAM-dependent methyltransferase
MRVLTDRLRSALACPTCGATLCFDSTSARCQVCNEQFHRERPDAPFDLRLKSPRKYSVQFDIPAQPVPTQSFDFGPIRANPNPAIGNYRDIAIDPLLRSGNRMNHELLSYFPKSAGGGTMLDLGCGNREFADLCSHTGYEYVGVDYSGDKPDLLADAHSLPFRDQSLDFVLSLAVLEHLRFPAVAMREVFRVLKAGGLFIGTVAFLEPFHMDSYAHLTHLGTYSVLAQAGFDVQVVAPNVEWSALHALSSMILFPRLPKPLCDLTILPLWLLHRAWWKLGHVIDPKPRTSESYRLPATTGGYRFVAQRPAAPASGDTGHPTVDA